MEKETSAAEKKADISGYIALILFILVFSGLLKGIPVLRHFDLMNMVGKYGIIIGAEGNFTGAGGDGASQGFMLCLSLLPTVMLCMGIVELAQHYGALQAAQQLLTPVMQFLMGVPGAMALSLVGSLNISDIGAVTTREMFEEGLITEDDRVRMMAFQFPSCAIINNLVTLMGLGLGVIMLSTSFYLVFLFIIKLICCNIMRLIMKTPLYAK